MQSLDQFAANTDAVFMAVEARLATFFTALPSILTQAGDGHIATAKSAILGLIRKDDESTQQLEMPSFDTMPVHFAGGGLVLSTHPLKSGDEGIALFFARALDSWHQSGGVQAPIDSRQHHLSDGVFLNGLRSDPNKLKNYATDSIQHRSTDGKVTHDVHPTNGTTTKVVDPSDSSANPFASATIFHQTTHNHSTGVQHTAKDSSNTHSLQLERVVGLLASVLNGSNHHTLAVAPPTGLNVDVTASGETHNLKLHPSQGHRVTVMGPGGTHSLTIDPSSGIALASSVAVALSAPPGGLSLPSGGVGAGALASGAAASNVGALGGGLSGSLPNPTVVAVQLTPLTVATLPAAAGYAGGLAYVTDATSLTNGSTVAGGGTHHAMVKCDGTSWIVLG